MKEARGDSDEVICSSDDSDNDDDKDDYYQDKNNFNSDSSSIGLPLEFELDLDMVIKKLLANGKVFNFTQTVLTPEEAKALAVVAREVMMKEDLLIKVTGPLRICGDIHGQFWDLLRLFELGGQLPKSRYLFLGDYVDRGRKGLECICLLLAYKVKYPQDIFLLRGNHESETITRVYGFRQEIIEKFGSSKIWRIFMKTFAMMPFAAVVENSIFCCHGGISPNLLKPSNTHIGDEFKLFKKPLSQVPRQGLLCDLMWADPIDQSTPQEVSRGWKVNPRGVSWQFGFDAIDEFLTKYNLDMIIRGHQVVEDGYEFYDGRRLITLFSAPHYMGQFDNSGAIFSLDADPESTKTNPIWTAGFLILKPDYSIPSQWFTTLKPVKKKK